MVYLKPDHTTTHLILKGGKGMGMWENDGGSFVSNNRHKWICLYFFENE